MLNKTVAIYRLTEDNLFRHNLNHLAFADQLMMLGQMTEAQGIIESAIRTLPETETLLAPYAHFYQGVYYFKMTEYNAAFQAFTHARDLIKRSSHSPPHCLRLSAVLYLAHIHLVRGDLALSEKYVQKGIHWCLEGNLCVGNSLMALTRDMFEKKHYSLVSRMLNRILPLISHKLLCEKYDYYIIGALSHFFQHHYTQTISYSTPLLNSITLPTHSKLLLYEILGHCYKELNHLPKAILSYTSALAMECISEPKQKEISSHIAHCQALLKYSNNRLNTR